MLQESLHSALFASPYTSKYIQPCFNMMNRLITLRSTLPRSLSNISSFRTISTSTLKFSQPTFNKPGPPLLSRTEQKDFDELQRKVNAPAKGETAEYTQGEDGGIIMSKNVTEEKLTMHPDFRTKPSPEFEGATNPVTGEVGGSKVEPLRYG